MFDTHVNLHGEQFESDLSDVLSRARLAGVSRMLAICDRLESFPKIVEIAQSHTDIWCSVGVHPHYADEFVELTADELIDLSKHSDVVAIGETGLDFHYGYSASEAQIESLRKHIHAARVTGLPIILHTREADELMGDILEEEYSKGAFLPLLHCYTGGQKLMERGLKLGAYVSASGIITFKNAREVREVIKQVPIDRIVVETDCPYLAPVPNRGRRNEPSFLTDVLAGLASLYEMAVSDVAEITTQNALGLFSKVQS